MTQLNQDTYSLLLSVNPMVRMAGGEDWYSITYQLFTDAPLDTLDDFWKIVAYTYSWMPTIPDVKPQLIKDTGELLTQLQALKGGDTTNLPTLLHQLVPVINNSLVGVSKVLHFIAPNQVPIIDRNVLSGWEVFFFIMYPQEGVSKLPNYKTALNRKHIPKYLEYRNVLLQWEANTNGAVTMRHLESAFFELGREVTPDHFKVYLPTL